ncbi:YhjD/YihY/BrkB family envelope integrity protein [Hippea jasoniae]|uniref:YhjD/YihY/BrkB family envelope integrity protein n=1 Tax=Hippea jasoniae TaxID=944479 RepID=UPI0005564E06|nr:YhjD/YihY/BrkB family envelope integrity protein [Hippea jasoniae]
MLFIKRIAKLYSQRNVFLWSALLTYLTVLNIVPFFYFVLFLLSHMPFVNRKIPYIKHTVVKIIPAYSNEILQYLNIFLSKISEMELLNAAIFSVSMLGLVLGFFKASKAILNIKEKTNPFKSLLFFVVNVILGGVAVSVAIALKIIIPLFLPHLGSLIYLKILPFIVWFLFLSFLFLPIKPKSTPLKKLFFVAFIITVAIFVLKLALTEYFSIFSYSKIYGMIAIVPSLLLWLFLLWNIILSGVMLLEDLGIEK